MLLRIRATIPAAVMIRISFSLTIIILDSIKRSIRIESQIDNEKNKKVIDGCKTWTFDLIGLQLRYDTSLLPFNSLTSDYPE